VPKTLKLYTAADREDVADVIMMRNWKSLFDDTELYSLVSNRKTQAKMVKTLEDAHNILTKLAPLFREDRDIPSVEIIAAEPMITVGQLEARINPFRGMDQIAVQLGRRLKITEVFAGGGLLSLAAWIKTWLPRTGPKVTKAVIAQAAWELREISKATVGKADLKWVETKLRQYFPSSRIDAGRAAHDLIEDLKKGKIGKLRRSNQKPPFLFLPNDNSNGDRMNVTPDQRHREAKAFFILQSIRRASDVIKSSRNRTTTPHRIRKSAKTKPHKFIPFRKLPKPPTTPIGSSPSGAK
jgi:hypothetical protein